MTEFLARHLAQQRVADLQREAHAARLADALRERPERLVRRLPALVWALRRRQA